MPPSYISALTGIRAVAAAMVFFGHLLLQYRESLPIVFEYGWTGVNVFFALSGYLFSYLYSDKLFGGTFAWSDYIKRRLIRIYPLTSLLILIVVLSQWDQHSLKDVLLHLTLLHSWFPDHRHSLISPMWTLTVEESYYFSAPILIYIMGMFFNEVYSRVQQSTVVKRIAALLLLSLLLWLATVAFANGSARLYQDVRFYFSGRWDSGAFTFTIFGRIVDFVSGMLAAEIARRMLPKRQFIGDGLVVLGCLAFVSALYGLESIGGPARFGVHKLGMLLQYSLGLSAAIVIYGLHSGGFFNRLLGSKPMIILGEASFALYLIQLMPFLWWPNIGMQLQYNLERAGFQHYIASIIAYIVLNLVSIGLYYAFERPLSRYLRHKFLSSR
jgi:peptidoglycan/LPS O-acetylase OafA/YrhL